MPKGRQSYEEIFQLEHEMVLEAPSKYGAFFENAIKMLHLLDEFAKTVIKSENYIAIVFLSQVKKHLSLALFSSVRRHHIQADMNFRQVLEAGSWAAYAMGNTEQDKFCEKNSQGNLDVPKRLKDAKNAWLATNYPTKSEEIKKLKELINDSTMHSNVVYAFQNFSLRGQSSPGFNTPFFDFEDEFKIKTDLWRVANIAMGLIDLLLVVNNDYGVFHLPQDFSEKFRSLVDQNSVLKEEMMQHERIQAVQRREQGNPKVPEV